MSLLFLSGGAAAAGLGKMSVQSALGQPLRAEIELLSVQPDDIANVEAKLASAEAFRKARMERSMVVSDLQLTIERRANGQPVVRISSANPVSDPFVDLLIELNWSSGRILREYTILLDPARDQNMATEMPKPAQAMAATSEPAPRARIPEVQSPSAPAKPAAKPTAPAPATYGPVKSGETLRSIARKVLPPDVTLEMMVASLYQTNKAAFARDNVNLLKQGQVLKVPDRDSAMLMFSPHQARQLLSEHAAAWNEMRNRVASQANRNVAESDTGQAGKGKIVAAQPQGTPAAMATPKDVLKLSKGEPANASAAQRVHSLEEEVVAKNRALQESQDRVSKLEQTVQDLQRLLELKAKDGAKTPAETPAKPEAVAAAEPKPPKIKTPVEVPVEQPGFFASLLATPLYIAGILATLVLAGLLWIFMAGSRRRKGLSDFEQSVMTGGDPFKTSIFKTDGGATSQRGTATQSGVATDFSRLGLGSIDTHEVDPIAEAEVYMAYGRDAQAEEILREALAKDPNRHEISLKLLEIYAARQDKATFETQASELYANLGDPSSPLWLKATEMGRKLDPSNPLYRVFGEVPVLPEVPGTEPEMPDMAEELPGPAAELASESLGDLQFDQMELPEPVASAPEAAAEEPESALQLDDLNFDEVPPALSKTDENASEADKEYPSFGEAVELDLAPPDEVQAATPILEAEPEPSFEMPEELGLVDLTPEPEASDETVMLPANGKLPGMDFSGLDLELAEPEEIIAKPVEPDAEAVAEIDPDLLEEVNTKLDLARAYLEMGDKEGAHEILDEVLKEGSDQQKQEAESLIASL
ncbi:MAG: hypothetical protein PHR30_16080 [Gallionellaceae bacterium]|nr:hypothetical protein [Gallionellaceae bacterium]